MTIYSVVLVIVTMTCLALSLWYARKLGDMLSKMAKHAQKLKIKSVELSNEKRRADTLLCQMLPKEVAEKLKMNYEVKAEQVKAKVKSTKIKRVLQVRLRHSLLYYLTGKYVLNHLQSCSKLVIHNSYFIILTVVTECENDWRSRPRQRKARSRPNSSITSLYFSATSWDSRTSRLAAVPWKSSTCSTLYTGRYE